MQIIIKMRYASLFIASLVSVLTFSLSINVMNDNSIRLETHSALAQMLVTPQINASNMSNNDNSLTYQNSSLGIKIQYPSDWSIERLQSNPNSTIMQIVSISPPIAQDPNATAGLTVGIDVNPSTNSSLDQYLRNTISNYRNPLANLTDFKLLSANTTNNTLGGKSAYTLVYSWNRGDDLGPTNTIETGTIVGNKVYYITFSAAAARFSTLIPTVKQIIDSLVITMPQPNNILVENSNNSTASSNNTTAAIRNATTRTTNNFLTYENTTFGIKISYPSDWVKQESHGRIYGFGITGIVNFTSPGLAAVRIDFANGASQNISLEQVKNEEINNLRSQGNINFTVSEPITLSGIPAYEVVYDILSSGIPVKAMQIFIVQNGGEYVLTYVSSPPNFIRALPTVQTMVESLQIANIHQQQQQINENQTSFSTYQNSSLGIKIQYPSSWNILGPFITKNGTLGYISFIAPIGVSSMDILTLNSSLTGDLSADDISKLDNTILSQQNGSLISSATVTLANGDPAHKVVFTRVIYPSNITRFMTNTFSIPNNRSNSAINNNPIKLQTMLVLSTKSEKPYVISYNAAQADYNRYQPIAQKMVASFQISPRAQASNPTILRALCFTPLPFSAFLCR